LKCIANGCDVVRIGPGLTSSVFRKVTSQTVISCDLGTVQLFTCLWPSGLVNCVVTRYVIAWTNGVWRNTICTWQDTKSADQSMSYHIHTI